MVHEAKKKTFLRTFVAAIFVRISCLNNRKNLKLSLATPPNKLILSCFNRESRASRELLGYAEIRAKG